MVYGQKFREQIEPFFISLAEDLCLALPTRGERRPAISLLRLGRVCSSLTIVSRPNILFQPRSMTRCTLTDGCSITAANHRRQYWQAIPLAAVSRFPLRSPCAIVPCRCAAALSRSVLGPISPAAVKA